MGLSDDDDFLLYGISFLGINSDKKSSPSPVATTASPPVTTAEDTIFIDQD